MRVIRFSYRLSDGAAWTCTGGTGASAHTGAARSSTDGARNSTDGPGRMAPGAWGMGKIVSNAQPNAQCPNPKSKIQNPKSITYSPAHTLVPTYECFNRCTYCNFRTDPGKSPWMELAHAEKLLRALQGTGTIEILILSGEVHPQSPRRTAWFQRIYDLCELALSLGFLPHTNAGPLSFEEMARLKEVNVSMGLMLEQLTPKLLETVHRHAPSKVPERRLQQLEWAGQLQIPFTTGLLLGIGETPDDWRASLDAIAEIHCRWGHIQEVILQPHSPGSQQTCKISAFSAEKLPEVVALARQILPPAMTLQIPPNLVQQPQLLLACLEAGGRDLGGIGPRDEVNPDYPHPHHRALAEILQPASWHLVRRLPVYPQYDSWLPVRLRTAVTHWRNRIAGAPY